MTQRDQYHLDFEGPRRERQAVFQAKLAGITPEAAGVTPARWGNVVRLLESLYYFAGADAERYAQPSPEALRKNADLSAAVISRTKADARDLGLLQSDRPRVRRGQKRPADQVWLNHDAIDALVAASRCGGISRIQVESGGFRWAHIKETTLPPNYQTTSPPPTRADDDRQAGEQAVVPVGWGEVFAELEAMGVGIGGEATTPAREAGATPADVAAVLSVWRDRQTPPPAAWGPGAVVMRLRRWRPGQCPTQDWPPANPDHERARSKTEQDARRRRDAELLTDKRRRQEAVAAVVNADRRRLAELDAAARRLPTAELDELLDAIADPALRKHARRNRFSAAVLAAIADGLGALTCNRRDL